MKKEKASAISYYVSAVLFYVVAAIYFWGDKNTTLGVVWFCLGSTMLCLGSVWMNKAKKKDDEKR